MVDFLEQLEGFIWDAGNLEKSVQKHGVSSTEAEEAFFNKNLISFDEEHSTAEPRFRMLGQSKSGKKLFIVFTIRNSNIRVISARLANKKERTIYEKAIKKTAEI